MVRCEQLQEALLYAQDTIPMAERDIMEVPLPTPDPVTGLVFVPLDKEDSANSH